MRYVVAKFSHWGMGRVETNHKDLIGYKTTGAKPVKDFTLATRYSLEEARQITKEEVGTCVYEILEDMDGELYLSQVGQGIL